MKSKKPVYLWIHNGEIEIRDASSLWGKTTTDTQWAIRKEFNDEEIKSLVTAHPLYGYSKSSGAINL